MAYSGVALGPGTLQLQIYKAQNLQDTTFVSKQDPYFVIKLNGTKKFTSGVAKDQGREPVWNYKADLEIEGLPTDLITIEIRHKGTVTDNDIGRVDIEASKLATYRTATWVDVVNASASNKDKASIQISTEWKPKPGNNNPLPSSASSHSVIAQPAPAAAAAPAPAPAPAPAQAGYPGAPPQYAPTAYGAPPQYAGGMSAAPVGVMQAAPQPQYYAAAPAYGAPAKSAGAPVVYGQPARPVVYGAPQGAVVYQAGPAQYGQAAPQGFGQPVYGAPAHGQPQQVTYVPAQGYAPPQPGFNPQYPQQPHQGYPGRR